MMENFSHTCLSQEGYIICGLLVNTSNGDGHSISRNIFMIFQVLIERKC